MKKFACLLLLTSIAFCGNKHQSQPGITASPEDARTLQSQTANRLGLPVQKTVVLTDGVTMDFILIPPGEFEMGSPFNESKRTKDEGPVHRVKISKAFYLGKYEVTQKQYESLAGVNRKLEFLGENLPVENVEWNQAVMFCNAAGKLAGAKMRLPSEAQWEYACRAGTTTTFYTGDKLQPDQANFNCEKSYNKSKTQRALERTAKVGSYPANPFGLYDMHGNVWEWCEDIYSSKYYGISPESDPLNIEPKGQRVVRGGAWNNEPQKLRCGNRSKRRESSDRKSVGFRVLMEID